jgi:SAM-dependent methyltransferase
VLDLGANAGYFSFRIAEDFPAATVIAIDDKPVLRDLAAANAHGNVVVVPRRLDAATLARLACCEQIDVVLALNVLHHMERAGDALVMLGLLAFHVVVETPAAGEDRAANARHHGTLAALAAAGREIGRFPSHLQPGIFRSMTVHSRKAPGLLTAQTLDAAPKDSGRPDCYELLAAADFRPGEMRQTPAFPGATVTAGFDAATIAIPRPKLRTTETRDFVPGLNLWSWALLGGCLPADPAALIRAELARLESAGRWMDDLRPWNFILTHDPGSSPEQAAVRAIDIGWKRGRTEPEEGGLDTCLALLAAARSAHAARAM